METLTRDEWNLLLFFVKTKRDEALGYLKENERDYREGMIDKQSYSKRKEFHTNRAEELEAIRDKIREILY